MDIKNKNIWITGGIFFISFVAMLIVIIILGVNLDNAKNGGTSTGSKVSSGEEYDEGHKMIRLDEDLSKDGKIENLEGVRWNNARIMQNDGQMEFSVMLNNESKDKKIKKQTLKVTLYDRSGKVIVSKDVEIKGINANYGYTDINLTFEMNELVIVDDVKIVASEENKEEKSEDKENSENVEETKDAEKNTKQ